MRVFLGLAGVPMVPNDIEEQTRMAEVMKESNRIESSRGVLRRNRMIEGFGGGENKMKQVS